MNGFADKLVVACLQSGNLQIYYSTNEPAQRYYDVWRCLAIFLLLSGRLFFSMMRKAPGNSSSSVYYFTVDETLQYENFFEDFGPLNLGQLFKYCRKIQALLKSPIHASKNIVHYTCGDAKLRVNAAFLAGAYAVRNFTFSL